MNATFSIHRLGLTIYKELQEKYMIILTSIGIILMIYLAFWALNLIDGEPVSTAARAASAATTLSIISCLAPFFLYKNENRRMEGVFYAVSPSSTLEKTISMLVICSVIFPLLSTVLLMSLDSLLTLMPFEASYSGSIWGSMFSSKEYLDKITNILNFNTDPMSIDMVNRMYDTINPLSGSANFEISPAPTIAKKSIPNDNMPATRVVRVSELAKIPMAMYMAPLIKTNPYPVSSWE